MKTFKRELPELDSFTKFKPAEDQDSKAHLFATRSNTPEEGSPSKSTFDSWNSNDEIFTPTTSPYGSLDNVSDEMDEPVSSFEIDVKPKKRKFKSPQERLQFVEGYKKKFKTEMCKNWELMGTCKFGDKCCFAHGRDELKGKELRHMKYKTKPCKQFHQTGYCPYGQRCQYLHKEAISPNIFFCPWKERCRRNEYTYEMLQNINTICATDATIESVFESIPKRPRLNVFRKVATL